MKTIAENVRFLVKHGGKWNLRITRVPNDREWTRSDDLRLLPDLLGAHISARDRCWMTERQLTAMVWKVWSKESNQRLATIQWPSSPKQPAILKSDIVLSSKLNVGRDKRVRKSGCLPPFRGTAMICVKIGRIIAMPCTPDTNQPRKVVGACFIGPPFSSEDLIVLRVLMANTAVYKKSEEVAKASVYGTMPSAGMCRPARYISALYKY